MHNTSNIKVLILDDDRFMLKLLTSMLTNKGFTSVSSCGNGADALKKIEVADICPDLILLDLNMPDMDGIEFVRYLVDKHYKGSLILVSGEDERILQAVEKLVYAHKIPMLGYLQKPFNPDKLFRLIENGVSPTLNKQIPSKNKVYAVEEIQAAISNHELVNYYQPTVAVATGQVVSVETLVRWNHPIDGLILPSQFIGIAEQNGLIRDLTCLVLINALAQTKKWQESGQELRIAINVSMENLVSLDFQDLVVDLVKENNLSPQKIILEVTESQLMGSDKRIPLEILTRLRLKKFHLSIDDFGTGHSSMTQLRDIPFDELKIDRSFVHHAWADEMLRAMYDASLSIAKQLNMVVVAEGVEDLNDWKLLRQTGCDLAQGYFISKPLQVEDFPRWMEEWQNRINNGLIVDPV